MNVLALDLGLVTGWAMLRGETLSCGKWDNNDKKVHAQKFANFRDRLKAIPKNIDTIVFEQVRRHAGTAAAHMYGGLVAVMLLHCIGSNISAHPIEVKVLKKAATGNGNAPKERMRDAANDFLFKHGFDNEPDLDFNTADALCALEYWIENADNAS